jgi:hypothetical protein
MQRVASICRLMDKLIIITGEERLFKTNILSVTRMSNDHIQQEKKNCQLPAGVTTTYGNKKPLVTRMCNDHRKKMSSVIRMSNDLLQKENDVGYSHV